MADGPCIVDSDVFIDHLRGSRSIDAAVGHNAAYSTITRAELFSGRLDDEAVVRNLLGVYQELPLTPEIAETAGLLRRRVSMALPDAIIAATALVHDLQLVTRNGKHFAQVPGLQVSLPRG